MQQCSAVKGMNTSKILLVDSLFDLFLQLLDIYAGYLKQDYIERSKRRSSGIGGLQVSMLEERAGWQYDRGSLVFPDSSVPKKKKRKNDDYEKSGLRKLSIFIGPRRLLYSNVWCIFKI